MKTENEIIGKWEIVDTINNSQTFNLNKKQNVVNNPPFKEIYFMPNGQKYWVFEGWKNNKLFVHYGGDEPILCFEFNIKKINNQDFMFLNVTDYDNKQYIMVLKQVSNKTYTVYEIGRRENVSLDFVLDKNILGRWKSVSFVSNINEFTGKEYDDTLWLKNITFKNDGTVIREYFNESWQDKWTKGKVLDLKKQVVSNYSFKTINNKQYMFLEWKMGNYVYGELSAEYYVFVKED